MALQITKHARISWLTRIEGMTYTDAVADTNFSKVEEAIAVVWEKAEYLSTDTIGGNPKARYFISDNIVFVVSEHTDKLATCYKVKYDLPNNLDSLVREELQKAIVDLRHVVDLEEEKVSKEAEIVTSDIRELENQVQNMKNAIKEAERAIQAKKDYVKTLDANALTARLDLQQAVRKLINSKELWTTHKGG